MRFRHRRASEITAADPLERATARAHGIDRSTVRARRRPALITPDA
jgi:hypothetical protein